MTQCMEVFAERIAAVSTPQEVVQFFGDELQRLGDSSFHPLRVCRDCAQGRVVPGQKLGEPQTA